MVATSPMQNDISNLGTANQVDIQTTSNIQYHQTWKNLNDFQNNSTDMNNLINNINSGRSNALANNSYEQLMNFASDEDDCFDALSDQANDDSVSSVGGVEDTRIQQL